MFGAQILRWIGLESHSGKAFVGSIVATNLLLL